MHKYTLIVPTFKATAFYVPGPIRLNSS